jgi:hypothetical protein
MTAETRSCATCGRSFEARRRGHIFCSALCRPSNFSRGDYEPGGVVPAEGAGDRRELIGLLWAAARRGSIAAARVLLEEIDEEGEQTEALHVPE